VKFLHPSLDAAIALVDFDRHDHLHDVRGVRGNRMIELESRWERVAVSPEAGRMAGRGRVIADEEPA